MMTPATIRKMLEGADATRDPYGVAQGARLLLAADPADSFARDQYIKALQALKLSSAAARVAGSSIATGASGGGVIPWSSRARRFAANLKALDLRSPSGATLVQNAATSLARYELHHAADGNFQVLDLEAPILSEAAWLGTLANHKAGTAVWKFDKKATPVPYPIAFDGLGFGWLVAHVLDSTANSFLNYSCALYFLESDPLALAMLLHMQDLTAMITAPRTRWFIGESPEQLLADFRRALTENTTWTIPEHYIRTALRPPPFRPWLDLEAAIHVLIAARQERLAALRGQIDEHYRGKDASYWATRFTEAQQGGPKLRVLGITSRYTTVLQHSMSELASAVNHTSDAVMDVAIEPDDHSLEDPYLEKIASDHPDLIVQISRMRHENPNLPRNVPFLTWDQDNLPCMRTPEATAAVRDGLTFVGGLAAAYGYIHLGWPASHVMPVQLAAATHRYRPRDATPQEIARYACDFNYISNAAEPASVLARQHAERFSGAGRTLFEAVADELLAADGPDGFPYHEGTIRDLVARQAALRGLQVSVPAQQEMMISALLVADRALRHQTLDWVAAFCRSQGKSLRLYGNGWERHPTLAQFAAGPARQGEELQAITCATRINLQIIGTGIFHSRLLDGIAVGGFFLYRKTYHEFGNLDFLNARQHVSRYVWEHALTRMADLDRAAAIDKHWQRLRPTYRETLANSGTEETTIMRGLAIAHRMPHPLLVMPDLAAIGFATREELAEKAGIYLEDPEARHQMSARLRDAVQKQFSYDVRWAEFLAGISTELSASRA